MSSAICFSLDQFKNLSSGNGVKPSKDFEVIYLVLKGLKKKLNYEEKKNVTR